jgi:response regulator of citrate/malate metabolism
MITSIRTILVDDEPGAYVDGKIIRNELPRYCYCMQAATMLIRPLKRSPNLILILSLLDIAMPVKNGFDLLKEIKEPGLK